MYVPVAGFRSSQPYWFALPLTKQRKKPQHKPYLVHPQDDAPTFNCLLTTETYFHKSEQWNISQRSTSVSCFPAETCPRTPAVSTLRVTLEANHPRSRPGRNNSPPRGHIKRIRFCAPHRLPTQEINHFAPREHRIHFSWPRFNLRNKCHDRSPHIMTTYNFLCRKPFCCQETLPLYYRNLQAYLHRISHS